MPCPGLVGDVPQVDAIGHVRPDFRQGHEEAALGGARFRGLVQLGLVPGREVERWVVYPPATNLGNQGQALVYSNGAVEVLLELVEEVRALISCQKPPQLATRSVAPSASKVSSP